MAYNPHFHWDRFLVKGNKQCGNCFTTAIVHINILWKSVASRVWRSSLWFTLWFTLRRHCFSPNHTELWSSKTKWGINEISMDSSFIEWIYSFKDWKLQEIHLRIQPSPGKNCWLLQLFSSLPGCVKLITIDHFTCRRQSLTNHNMDW